MAATQTTHHGESSSLPHRFAELMREGTMAYSAGNRRQAHLAWRRAATLQPEREEVWVALLDVLETDADRRVCLENILTINPNNARAQRMIRRFTIHDDEPLRLLSPLRPARIWRAGSRSFLRTVVWWLEGALLGAALAILFSIILYGGL